MVVEIMDSREFEEYLEEIKKELAYMKPGDAKRVALIGVVGAAGTGGRERAFTNSQLNQLFNLGFPEKE